MKLFDGFVIALFIAWILTVVLAVYKGEQLKDSQEEVERYKVMLNQYWQHEIEKQRAADEYFKGIKIPDGHYL